MPVQVPRTSRQTVIASGTRRATRSIRSRAAASIAAQRDGTGPVDADDVAAAVERSTDRVVLTDRADVLERIDTLTVDQVARTIYVERHGSFTVMPEPEQKAPWPAVVTETDVPFAEAFLAEEWRQIVLAQDIITSEQYRTATRTGRGKSLTARQRERAWTAVQTFATCLAATGKTTWEAMCAEATRRLREGARSRYRHIVIDEAQDLSLVQWRFLWALVPPPPGGGDLFLAGMPTSASTVTG